MSAPRVSVVIPTYNRSQALRGTIDSVLAQTMPDWELWLVNDGSTDDTEEVCRSYVDPRIECITQPNQGQAAARGVGLKKARGDLVAFLDHDDRWLPHKLERQVAHLDAHPHHGLVYGRIRRIDERGENSGDIEGFEQSGWLYRELLVRHNFLWTMSLPMMRTELVREVGGFNTEFDISDDLDLFLRLSRRVEFGCIREVLIEYNVGNPLQQSKDIFRTYRSERQCVEHHLRTGPTMTREDLRAIRRSWGTIFAPGFRERGWYALRSGRYREAWRCYAYAVRLNPGLLRDAQAVRDLLALCKASVLGNARRT